MGLIAFLQATLCTMVKQRQTQPMVSQNFGTALAVSVFVWLSKNNAFLNAGNGYSHTIQNLIFRTCECNIFHFTSTLLALASLSLSLGFFCKPLLGAFTIFSLHSLHLSKQNCCRLMFQMFFHMFFHIDIVYANDLS